MASAILAAFFVTLLFGALLYAMRPRRAWLSEDRSSGPQTFHFVPTSRLAGVAIFAGLLAGTALIPGEGAEIRALPLTLVLLGVPAFLGGLLEDITKRVPQRTRLLFTFVSAALAYIILDGRVTEVDVPGLDWLLAFTVASFVFSLFAVGGFAHAMNIVDGFNGLAGVLAVIFLGAIAYVALLAGDEAVFTAGVVFAAAVAGFLILNYPRGLVFLGDGGAYLLGFLVAELAVLLVQRNSPISPWFALLLFAYPVWETLFSSYRKKVLRGRSPGEPDGLHLHMLVHRRIVRRLVGAARCKTSMANALTSPFLWAIALAGVVPAILFRDESPELQVCAALFIALYLFVYWRIVRFRTPAPFALSAPRAPVDLALVRPTSNPKDA